MTKSQISNVIFHSPIARGHSVAAVACAAGTLCILAHIALAAFFTFLRCGRGARQSGSQQHRCKHLFDAFSLL
jgi:hypothetical protein